MNVSSDHPVAVFDSGVGGLTVLHELLVSLPTEPSAIPAATAAAGPELEPPLSRSRS